MDKLENMRSLIDLVEANEEASFDYPDAGRNAPPLVQKAIKEFHNESDSVKSKTPLLYYLLGDGTPPYKMSKKDTQYTDHATQKTMCKNCEFMYTKVSNGANICSQINGNVSPEGWCNQYQSGDNA